MPLYIIANRGEESPTDASGAIILVQQQSAIGWRSRANVSRKENAICYQRRKTLTPATTHHFHGPFPRKNVFETASEHTTAPPSARQLVAGGQPPAAMRA